MDVRRTFHTELRALEDRTLGALDLVDLALARTGEAVQAQDTAEAATVINGDDELDARYLDVKRSLLTLLARQTPVATDLRLVAALLVVVGHVERMGDQCVNVAKRVPFGGRPAGDGDPMLERLAHMASVARLLTREARDAFRERDVAMAEALVAHDDELDRLNRECFALAVQSGGDADANEWAMQAMLVARWLERVGDHAVDIGEEAAFVVTGEFREFTDASHPGGVRL
jgi:phosphate transport system protein